MWWFLDHLICLRLYRNLRYILLLHIFLSTSAVISTTNDFSRYWYNVYFAHNVSYVTFRAIIFLFGQIFSLYKWLHHPKVQIMLEKSCFTNKVLAFVSLWQPIWIDICNLLPEHVLSSSIYRLYCAATCWKACNMINIIFVMMWNQLKINKWEMLLKYSS